MRMQSVKTACLALVMAAVACNAGGSVPTTVSTIPVATLAVASDQPTDVQAVNATLTPIPATLVPTSIPTDTPIPTATPFGCERPPDDYTRIEIQSGIVLNQRTLTMLLHAQTLYGGSHDFMAAITQGSYTTEESASFGTHEGGGAVDLSVRDLNTLAILYDDIPVIILALREAGFAAWVREVGELYPNSPIHIHAIAVGDAELSEAAQRQITGAEGYFRGFNGLPVDPPAPDQYGPPVICPWMIEMGYTDLRLP